MSTTTKIPCIIYVILSDNYPSEYFGIKDALKLTANWRAQLSDHIIKTIGETPYVFDRDECISKVSLLKNSLEQFNSSLLVPMSITAIAVLKAEFDKFPPFLDKLKALLPSANIPIYFSNDAIKLLHFTEGLELRFDGNKCLLIEQYNFSVKRIKDSTSLIVTNSIECIFSFTSKDGAIAFQEQLLKETKLMHICAIECVQNKYFVTSYCDKPNIKFIYDWWVNNECSCFISRRPEILLDLKGDVITPHCTSMSYKWADMICDSMFVVCPLSRQLFDKDIPLVPLLLPMYCGLECYAIKK